MQDGGAHPRSSRMDVILLKGTVIGWQINCTQPFPQKRICSSYPGFSPGEVRCWGTAVRHQDRGNRTTKAGPRFPYEAAHGETLRSWPEPTAGNG